MKQTFSKSVSKLCSRVRLHISYKMAVKTILPLTKRTNYAIVHSTKPGWPTPSIVAIKS